jgi:hypothetical protein
MSNDQMDKTAAPPLAALGGWQDADWFSPSILTDDQVIGFTIPPVAGLRKQSFVVVDRTAHDQASPAKTKATPGPPPKRLAGKLAQILDAYGATAAVSCSRSRFIFESAPLLFFADIPLKKLKARAATKLRNELIGIGVTGCIVHVQNLSATGMFWPAAESGITDFVVAAAPDHALHPAFDFAPKSVDPRAPALKTGRAAQRETRDTSREKRLLREVDELRRQVEASKRAQSTVGAMALLGLDDARLKSMLKLLHPDKHGGSEAASEAAKWLNNLREALKAEGK